MSIMICEGCGGSIDTDYKPFYYDVKVGYISMNLCENCHMILEEKGLLDDLYI